MSIELFKQSYKNSDINQLRKYIKLPKLLSTKKFVTYTESSFTTNREVYDILVLILFNQYDLTKFISNIIDRDNVDLLEDILRNDYDAELDENLISKTIPKGRVSMAKAIYEYIYDVKKNSYKIIEELLHQYNFIYNEEENSIDSFVLSMLNIDEPKHTKNIIHYINPNFWDNFAIKFACKYCYPTVVRRLLLNDMVDPGVGNNYPLKIAMNGGNSEIINEVLKHPLVTVDYITSKFIDYAIHCNYVYVVEKILKLGDSNTISLFKRKKAIDLMIERHNDVTYLAIKLGIFNVSELINFYPKQKINIKKHLGRLKVDNVYISKPYEVYIDPDKIFKKSIKCDDIDSAKSIKNYPVSVPGGYLLVWLEQYDNSVSDYIYDEVISTYNPNDILPKIESNDIFKKVFNIMVINDLDIDYEYVYLHRFIEDYNIKSFILKYIKKTYDDKYYKKFRKNVGL
jgi:hypothetical protein